MRVTAARVSISSFHALPPPAAVALFHNCALRRAPEISEHADRALWQELYHHDYQKKSRLARFLTAATELVEERKAKRAGKGGAPSKDDIDGDGKITMDEHFLVHGKEHGGYELPPGRITLEVAKEMASQLSDGERLRSSSLIRLLDESQAILSTSPNITLIPAGTKVTVVGDLHGSLADLLKVFELAGWPNEDDSFVFNGDFVDRGDRGVEVLALLLALKISFPTTVHLNRGNHEDTNVGRAYGFFEEVMTKYGSSLLYARIGHLFCHLPLCAVLENEAFIVHAGIPSEAAATIYHIGAVARANITSTVAAKWAASRAVGAPTSRPRSLGLVEDLLWSDPVDPREEPGAEEMCERNMIRGAGSRFGPMLVQRWLQKLNCFALVRSHECPVKGWSTMPCGGNTHLFTVFSHANYQGGGNDAAILVFPGDGLADPEIITWQPHVDVRGSLGTTNRKRLVDLICRHKAALRAQLHLLANGLDWVSVKDWSSAMRKVLLLEADFTHFAKALAPVHEDKIVIDAFLQRYMVQVRLGALEDVESTVLTADEDVCMMLMDKKDLLVPVFRLLDHNGDGLLSKEEIFSGCALLNDRLPEHEKVSLSLARSLSLSLSSHFSACVFSL